MHKNRHGIQLVENNEVVQTVTTGCTHRKEWLAELVCKNGWTHGAEIGVHKGDTFFYLLDHCRQLHMIGVDPWTEQPDNPGQQQYTESHWHHDDNAERIMHQAARYGRALIIRGYSVRAAREVADESLDFVFIDADHNEVAADIVAWRPKLKPNGKLVGHDINWVSVKADVDRLIIDYDIGPNQCWLQK